jgi:hypothetical protein
MSAHLHLAPNPGTAGAVDRARIRVVLADDHALVRRSLRLLLDGEQDVDVIGEAGDLKGVARHVYGYSPQVFVLDLQMPGGSSMRRSGRSASAYPRPRSWCSPWSAVRPSRSAQSTPAQWGSC